ncbi:hypothetical protein ACJX0J_040850, partial [Zea mays]
YSFLFLCQIKVYNNNKWASHFLHFIHHSSTLKTFVILVRNRGLMYITQITYIIAPVRNILNSILHGHNYSPYPLIEGPTCI